jgi:hypothetical protein
MRNITACAIVLFLTGCGSSTTIAPGGEDPFGFAGAAGSETGGIETGGTETGGFSTGGSVSTGGTTVETGGSAGAIATGGTVGTETGGTTTSTGGAATTDYVLAPTCRLVNDSEMCNSLYGNTHPIQFQCDNEANYPTTDEMTAISTPGAFNYWISATNPDNPSIKCVIQTLADVPNIFCCNIL